MNKTKLLFTTCFSVLSFTIVFSQTPTITSSSPLPAGTIGVAYKDTLKATGPGPISWTITGLPAGLSAPDSIISGTPTVTGTFTVNVIAHNSNGNTGPLPFSLTIVPAAVPSVYTQLYAQLSTGLADFHDTINKIWNGHIDTNVLYTGQLTAANCNNGSALLSPSSMPDILTQLLLLKAIGVKAISVEVSFPMLYSPFLESVQSGYQSQFLAFYTNLADTIRKHGFKLVVECQAMNTGVEDIQGNWPTLPTFYSSLTLLQYFTARATTAATVASAMKPDYIILQEEPRTEQTNTGKFLDTVTNSTRMLDSSLKTVRALGIPGMKVGAGFGTWLEDYQRFANSFTQTACGGSQPCVTTPLDFLDIHIFPILENAIDYSPGKPLPPGARNFQKNTLNVLATATAASMPVTLSQGWLRKVRDDEWEIMTDLPYSPGNVQEAREAYSFWINEDTSYLSVLYGLANYQGMKFLAPFNTQNWSAYLTWNNGNSIKGDCGADTAGPCGTTSPLTVFADVETAARTINVPQANYTATGQHFHDLIIRNDVTAPSAPTGVVVVHGASQTVDTLKWIASTDNVGVGGYHIWRDSVQLHDIFQSPFIDSTLVAGHTYCYQVQAFDLAGNVSGKVNGCAPAGIDNLFTATNVNIYPNPSGGTFVIEDNMPEQKLLRVYDVVGKLVHTETLKLQKSIVDVSNLSPGVYNVSLSTNGEIINKKLVIVK